MARLNSIHQTLDQLEKKWFSEKPPFSEAVIAAALLVELFRGSNRLGFNERSARRECDTPGGNGCIDILLRVNPRSSVVVELKLPGMLQIGGKRWKTALKQAGRYVRDTNHTFGIVTDGINWFYFKLVPFGNFHRIHILAHFNIKLHRRLAVKALQRSRKGSLLDFFALLTALHFDMTPKTFAELMNLSINERVDTLVRQVSDKDVNVTALDKSIIRSLYSGARAGEIVRPIWTR